VKKLRTTNMNERETYLIRARKWIDESDDLAIEQIEAVIEQFSCRLQNLKMLEPDNKRTIGDLQMTIEYLNAFAVKIGGEDSNDQTGEKGEGVDTSSQTYTFNPSSLVNYSDVKINTEATSRNVSVIHDLIKKGMVRRGF